MGTRIEVTPGMGGSDGYRGDLPLDRELETPIVVDASLLRSWHPMFAIRLLQHGRDKLGAYVAADSVDGDTRLYRLAIADLGIGIPEHIRARHPEWQDDAAAITRALERGVSGTGDPYRGNGFAEVLDEAMAKVLVRAKSSVKVDIRSSKGRVVVELVDGRQQPSPERIRHPRRGTWITYTVETI